MSESPLSITVVIPVLNDAEALEVCLQALAGQSRPADEVVVVDNGCTDNSVQVATTYAARVVTEPVRGIPAASSAGYDAARCEVIARLDADSVPPPDWVARILARLSAEPSTSAVTGGGRFYGMPVLGPVVGRLYMTTYFLSVHAALGHTTMWGSNMALRRATWLEVRDLVHRNDAEVHDDIDLAFALGPERVIRYDRGLSVGVSARSLVGGEQLRRRLRRGVRTLRLNWERQPPWERWEHRIRRTWRRPRNLEDRRD